MSFSFKKRKGEKIEIDCGNKVVFAVLGVNNVGSYVSYELAQIASLSSKRTDIVFIDNKTVNEQDVKYGKFTKLDIGKRRAEITANRCSASFNIDIETVCEEIKNREQILRLFKGRMGYFPVIICNSQDENLVRLLDSALEYISDVAVIMTKENAIEGELTFSYKKDGSFVTKNYIKAYTEDKIGSKSKACSLEMCKNVFLYLDDILCERVIGAEKVLFNVKEKTVVSKEIKGDEICLQENKCNSIKINVNKDILCIVIGVGGTGASLAYEIAHLASVSEKNIKMVFIDGDIVEAKNLNRQRFVVNDLNKYKAEVTAKRCRMAYNVDIVDKNEYITSEDDLYGIIREYKGYTPIILGCSDSLKLRYLVCEAVKKAHTINDVPSEIIYIDAGNGEDYGQVNFTYVKSGEYITPDYFQTSPKSLEDVFEAKLVTQMSCDELMNSAPQTKGANMASAVTMYSYLEDVVYENPISSYITYFNNVSRRVESKWIY